MRQMNCNKAMFFFAEQNNVLDNAARRKVPAVGGASVGVKARSGAFTLIELLVVIAIIAILAAILLPVLDRAKKQGLKAQCINNFKQLQLCYHMYVDDNSDNLPLNFYQGLNTSWLSYPPGGSAQFDYNTKNIRTATLYPYNQNQKIYVCPANTYLLTVGAGGFGSYYDDFGHLLKTGQQVPQTRTCSIEFSMGGNYKSNPGGAAGPWTITAGGSTWNSYEKMTSLQTAKVATKIVFVDEASGSVDDGVFAMYAMNTLNDWWNLPTSRHLNGGVFSFADGHVEYWKWHGTAISGSQFQTVGPGNGGPTMGLSTAGDSSDDLARVQAGGPQYP